MKYNIREHPYFPNHIYLPVLSLPCVEAIRLRTVGPLVFTPWICTHGLTSCLIFSRCESVSFFPKSLFSLRVQEKLGAFWEISYYYQNIIHRIIMFIIIILRIIKVIMFIITILRIINVIMFIIIILRIIKVIVSCVGSCNCKTQTCILYPVE